MVIMTSLFIFNRIAHIIRYNKIEHSNMEQNIEDIIGLQKRVIVKREWVSE